MEHELDRSKFSSGTRSYFKNEAVSKTYLPVGKVGYCDARSRNLSGQKDTALKICEAGSMGINEANFFSLFSTLSIRTELTVFFYQSEVKESSGMLNIHFGLALIDTLSRWKMYFPTHFLKIF